MQTTIEIETESSPVFPGVQPQRNAAARQLLREWLADESGYDEETWPVLKSSLEQNRGGSERRLFSD